jgi:tetratricopeptide (TPR) repeat protein
MEERKTAVDHYERGRVLKYNQMFDEALKEFQQAATDPQYAGNAHVQMALCLRATDRGEAAVEAFRRALTLATFSSKEKAHILYFLGQTLESLGRYAEALEAYGWTRKEDPGFQDVAHRIKHLISGGRGPVPHSLLPRQFRLGDTLKLGRQLTLQLLSLLGQTWESLGGSAGTLKTDPRARSQSPSIREVGHQNGHRTLTPNYASSLASRDRKKDKRQHARVAVRLRGHFSSKGQMVAGDGELRDLSLGGCRVTSRIAVPVGVMLECCIYPQGADNPFTIDGAMVRWSRPQEFGLAFTTVRPGVQRQIAQLCGTRTPLGVEI